MKWVLIIFLASLEYDSGIEPQIITAKFDSQLECKAHIVEEKDFGVKYRLQSFCMLEEEFKHKFDIN